MKTAWAKLTLVSVLAASLTACGKQVEPSLSPGEQLAPVSWKQWTGPVETSRLTWNSFQDPILEDMISEALENNLTIESAARSLERARIQHNVTDGTRQPQVSAQISAERAGQIDGGSSSLFSLSIPASYEFDVWGRRAHRVEAARLQTELASLRLHTVRISIASSVADFYFSLRSIDRQLSLKARSRESIVRQRDMTASRVKGGVAITRALDQLEVQVANLETSIEELKSQRRQQEGRLAVLLGKMPQDFTFEVNPGYLLPGAPPLSIGTPAEVLRHRPDIKTAELQLLLADIEAEQVRTQLFPSLTVTAAASTNADKLDGLFDFVSLPWSVGSFLTLPILDGGARKADVLLATLEQDEQVTQYRQSVLDALVDVETALASEASLRRQQATAERQRQIQERISSDTKAMFNSGRLSSLDLIIEEQNLINIEETEVRLWQQSMAVTISLLRAFGVDPAVQ